MLVLAACTEGLPEDKGLCAEMCSHDQVPGSTPCSHAKIVCSVVSPCAFIKSIATESDYHGTHIVSAV